MTNASFIYVQGMRAKAAADEAEQAAKRVAFKAAKGDARELAGTGTAGLITRSGKPVYHNSNGWNPAWYLRP